MQITAEQADRVMKASILKARELDHIFLASFAFHR
jgi:hypothetical protein